jgi:chromosome partitioning protein
LETSAFVNHKGGVGKTTSVVNIGAGLAILGERVLLVDLDPQGHLTRFLGVEPSDVRATIDDVLRNDLHPREAVISRPLRARLHIDGRDVPMSISVIPSTLAFASAEAALSGAEDREFKLKRSLARLGGDYDHVLLDCSASLGLISVNAMVAARRVFVPVQAEYLALHSLENLLAKVESAASALNPDLEIGGLIATRFDGRKVLSRVVVETLQERFGALLLNTIIRDNIALAESPRFGKDIFSYRPHSPGAEDYLNLATEILDRFVTADDFEASEMDVLEHHAGIPR